MYSLDKIEKTLRSQTLKGYNFPIFVIICDQDCQVGTDPHGIQSN